MKLKRFTAPDIRQAMGKVRDELGPDAVILSNRKTDEGIEIIAATDYDDAIVQTSPNKTSNENVPEKSKGLIKPKNTKQLAEHLSNKFDLGNQEPTWKKALEQTYVKEQPAEKPEKKRKPDKKSKAETNTSQVSNEWLDKFGHSEDIVNPPEKASLFQNAPKAENTEDMKKVWNELSDLRGLLETQLSSLAWNDINKRKPQKAKVLKHLLDLGLTPNSSYALLEGIDDNESFESCWRKSLAKFTKSVPTVEEDMINAGGMFALVGPTGVGKTTTIAKMAARYALTHGTSNIALVTTDNYRIGAQEQLRTYGRILGTPVKVANGADELRKTLKGLYDKDLVLIDTAGMSQRDMRLTEQFSMLSEGSTLIKTYLVLSASSQQKVLEETVQAYKKAFLDGCIVTKIDESITLGGVLSTISETHLPIAYISDGQRVPEDLHRAKALDLVKKAVSMMNEAGFQADANAVGLAFGGLVANDLT